MARISIAMLVVATTFTFARAADAAPVTLNFAGQWTFFDPQQDAPDFWAAMAGVGVVPGADVFWSLTIDSAAIDQNSDPAVGVYDAVLGSTLRLGSLTLASGPGRVTVRQTSGPELISIENLGPAVQGYAPQYLQLQPLGPWSLPSDGLLSALTQIGSAGSRAGMILGFNNPPRLGSAQFQGLAEWKLVSIPAPAGLPVAAVGIATFVLYRRCARLRR